ncbi:MAG: hypothetical protein KAT91_01905 [Candidatus Aenigmarchaeota archaeon]|nr:hypothetical protein [Candidatus Aenigmarchaeota archaeon]
MNCNKCNLIVEKKWNYCPSCGSRTKTTTIDGLAMDDVLLNIMHDLKEVFLAEGHKRSANNIVVGISNQDKGLFDVDDTNTAKYSETKTKKFKIKNTKEPKAKTLENRAGKLVIQLHIPGIHSKNNIHVDEFEESCEIRAKTKDTLYFKILKTPPNMSLKAKELKGEKLSVTFGL